MGLPCRSCFILRPGDYSSGCPCPGSVRLPGRECQRPDESGDSPGGCDNGPPGNRRARTGISNELGNFDFASIPTGAYEVRVGMAGFKSFFRADVP